MIRTVAQDFKKARKIGKVQSRPLGSNVRSKDIREVWYDEYGVDERTDVVLSEASTIVTKEVDQTVGFSFTLSPYEKGKLATRNIESKGRNNFWGFDAGLDYEQQIIAKMNASLLLEAKLKSKAWSAAPIVICGESDCYQPIERKLKITRQLLEIFLKYKHPVTITTKSALILRDLDLLTELSKFGLVSVVISINTLNNELHQAMEPRTSTPKKRMHTVKVLASRGIPVSVLAAPIIPGLNDEGIFTLVKVAAQHGALNLQQQIVRLNGEVGKVFKDWVRTKFPYRWRIILKKVADMHQGSTRMSGSRNYVDMLHEQFEIAKKTYGITAGAFEHNTTLYDRTAAPQMSLF